MPDELLLSVRQVCERTGFGKERIYHLIASGELPSIVIGTRRNGMACRRKIRAQALEDLLIRLEQETTDQLAAASA